MCALCMLLTPSTHPVPPDTGEEVSLHRQRPGSWSETCVVGPIIAPWPLPVPPASSSHTCSSYALKCVSTTPGRGTVPVASREGGGHWVARACLEACLGCQRLFHMD